MQGAEAVMNCCELDLEAALVELRLFKLFRKAVAAIDVLQFSEVNADGCSRDLGVL